MAHLFSSELSDSRDCGFRAVEHIFWDDGTKWYRNTDTDDFGNPLDSVISITPPENHVANNFDCDDSCGWHLPSSSMRYIVVSGAIESAGKNS